MSYESEMRAFSQLYATLDTGARERLTTSVSERTRAILNAEGIDTPSIDFHVMLTAHGTAQDASFLKQGIESCDIFVPELKGHTPEYAAILNRLSQGEITPSEAYRLVLLNDVGGDTDLAAALARVEEPINNFQEFTNQLYRSIYNSKKHITFADITHENPVAKKTNAAWAELHNAELVTLYSPQVSYQSVCKRTGDALRSVCESQKEREEHMVEELPNALASVIRNDTSLHKPRTSPIKVSMFLGAAHANVPRNMAESGDRVGVARTPSGDPKTMSHFGNVFERSIAGTEITSEDTELVTLSVIFSFLYQYARKNTKKKFSRVVNKLGDGVVPTIMATVFRDIGESVFLELQANIVKIDGGKSELNEAFIWKFFARLVSERSRQINAEMDRMLK